jgi:SAM-dependent methyltransferase
LSRPCAVCDSREKRVLFQQPLVIPDGLRSYAGHDIVICLRCGFIYADSATAQGALDAYYTGPTKAAQALREIDETEADAVRLANSAAMIGRSLKPEHSLLDVGCGAGRLLGLLKSAGFPRVSGLDPPPAAAALARSKYGVPVAQGSVFDFDGGEYDFLAVCHVLEHIADLPAFLRRIYSLLADEGMAYIEVPDVRQFERFADPRSSQTWIYVRDLFTHFAPEHVNFFSVVSLRNLMTRAGFEEVFCEPHPLGVIASTWKRRALTKDEGSEAAVLRYAAHSRAIGKSALERIERLAESGVEVLVWGAGLHTQRLLASGGLAKLNIRKFIDSDPLYQGTTLAGKPVVKPEEIAAIEGCPPIVISSWKAREAILQAMESMGLPNRPILLYAREGSGG